ncbi:RQC (ribosome quality control complex) component [Saccharomyces cerevisiae]|nr:CLN_G0011860.mRNA.1.CDS.1 [Saccharomyces cerevisiae]CAI4366586.1 ADQ_G0011850.mRNA.1.CDS.1 [Saccharomyces cerevisiae]CAI5252880.1 CMF_HP2_G0011810.mRNA.1.CDS.1 [Saccharomyces cerevisiae]CAI6441343.1 CMF_HP2_G0011810.mRNA.1.CDS.1 [Saccharomyces cerevisiae]CAI6442944.1 CMF_HP1_G0012020.mRNA.1.CDS.1 [Saccharomyces cerevisiae]
MSSRALRRLQDDNALLESLLSSSNANKMTSGKSTAGNIQKRENIFSMMDNVRDSDNSTDEGQISEQDEEAAVAGERDTQSNAQPKRITLASKSSRRKKNKKAKRKQKNHTAEAAKDKGSDDDDDDEEFDKIIQQFKKTDILKYGKTKNDDTNEEGFFTASEPEEASSQPWKSFLSLESDPGFTKFPISCLRHSCKFFQNDFKKLDPHTEFKLLFDDISPESLEDIDSMTSTPVSPQQLKQIQRLKRLIRNWGGKDHRLAPNGPGMHPQHLKFTKIRDDWIPTQRGELSMKLLSSDDLLDWQLWERPLDWKDVIQNDVSQWQKFISFYKFEPLNSDLSKKSMMDFYLSVIVHPDHEALINLISSKFPYHVPGLLQVALIFIRQGDRSNTNGLLQRALFVFDRALKANIIFDSLNCQLPYIYFFNRQFYLAIFRYIQSLAQRGVIGTASEWTKVLWSLSPLEDPLGCRYFLDHYFLLNNDYQYIIELSNSPLMNCYKQWNTLGFSLAVVLSFLRINEMSSARNALLKAFKHHPLQLSELFKEKLLGDHALTKDLSIDGHLAENLELKAYMARFPLLWNRNEEVTFLHDEMSSILQDYHRGNVTIDSNDGQDHNNINNLQSPFFIAGIPINLLRFAILSEESSVMAAIPSFIWSDNEVYEFDVLPPMPTSKESIEVVENIKTFINEKDLAVLQAERMQDEDLLNQIRQISLQQYIHENEESNENEG